MIKVNLIGAKKKTAKAGMRIALPTSVLPFVLLLIVLGTGAGGYFWYMSLTAEITDLGGKIASLGQQKAALDTVIKQNEKFEGRKKALEARIKIIEGLKRNQVNPVLAMDVLSEAIRSEERR